MSPVTLLKDARTWVAVVLVAIASLILMWWFWYSIELMRALSLVHVEHGTVSVDGVEISNPSLASRDRETHDRWRFWSQDVKDPTGVAVASCGWNTYNEREALIPFSIPTLYHQAVSTITRKVGRQPEVYRWEDAETWGRLSAVWQFETQYIEVKVGHNNDNDGIGIVVIPGRLNWDAETRYIRQLRRDRRLADEQDVEKFLSTFRGW